MKNKITIHTKKVKFRTAPEFYGLFFEDINHAADGGLYPEMIRNRAFEDSLVPEGCITDKEQKIFITEHNWPQTVYIPQHREYSYIILYWFH